MEIMGITDIKITYWNTNFLLSTDGRTKIVSSSNGQTHSRRPPHAARALVIEISIKHRVYVREYL